MGHTSTSIQSTSQLARCAVTGTPCNAHTFFAIEADPQAASFLPKLIRATPLVQIPVRPAISRDPAYQEIVEWLRNESDRIWNTYRAKVKAITPSLVGRLGETGTFKVCFEQTYIDATQEAHACIEDVADENAARAEFNSVFTRLYPGSVFKILGVERLGDYPMPLPQEK